MKVSIPYIHDDFSYALVEKLTAIAPRSLRLIPNIDIVIRLPYYCPGIKSWKFVLKPQGPHQKLRIRVYWE